MSTNRPFFSGFLSAFRARSGFSGFQKASTSPTAAVSGASLTKAQKSAAMSTVQNALDSSMNSQSNNLSQGPTSTVSPLNIKSDSKMLGTATGSVSSVGVSYQRQHHHHHHHHNSPGTSPGPSRGFRSGSLSPNQSNTTASRRRGSDSSSEGFREIMGADKWFIGGRTAAGEEKFYRLEMIRKPRSIDRLSADRLSI